jgi:glutathione S-transferase
MADAVLTISSKNYSSWSLRGWLLCKFAGLSFEERQLSSDDESTRKELLLLSPSVRVPSLAYDGVTVWDTIAIAEFLNDVRPEAELLPRDRAASAYCRSICGEMHSGFVNLRSALPMNLRAHHPGFHVYPAAAADVARITEIWRDALDRFGGPFLFGERSMADAMFAPVATRFATYDVKTDPVSAAYAARILALPEMLEWKAAALAEPDDVEELDAEF